MPARILNVREQVIRVHCPGNGVPADGSGLVLEFQDRGCVAGYYARVLTASPDSLGELVLLRSASLIREELRSSLRVPAEISVTLESSALDRPLEGRLVNISSGGAYVETTVPLRVNGDPRLHLSMSDEPALRILGDVVHAEKCKDSPSHRFGVRFVDVPPEDVRAITWYIWSRVRAFFPESD